MELNNVMGSVCFGKDMSSLSPSEQLLLQGLFKVKIKFREFKNLPLNFLIVIIRILCPSLFLCSELGDES